MSDHERNDDPLDEWRQTPYGRGYTAAMNPQPAECPYPEDSPEADEWWDGFGDATDSLWNDP